jgi:endonuclease/exonuclease/phosphatase (EEP) superfamily protein YafD
MKTVIVAGDINSPENRSLRTKRCQDGRTAEKVQTLHGTATTVRVTRTVPILFIRDHSV